MDDYRTASRRGELVVTVSCDEVPVGVRLSPAVMDLSAEELASRIVRLNTLARLRCQLATNRVAGRSVEQVAAYARTIDF